MAKVTGQRGKAGRAKSAAKSGAKATAKRGAATHAKKGAQALTASGALRRGARPRHARNLDATGTAPLTSRRGGRHEASATPSPAKRVKAATNLTLDPALTATATAAAKTRGRTLSALVNGMLETYVRSVTAPSAPARTPAVRRLVGIAAGGQADEDDYRAHLLEKYGAKG